MYFINVVKTKILLLDKFTTGLDISIKYNLTFVIISHDVHCIKEMVDKIIILANKKIYIDAYTKDIIQKFGSVKKWLKNILA